MKRIYFLKQLIYENFFLHFYNDILINFFIIYKNNKCINII